MNSRQAAPIAADVAKWQQFLQDQHLYTKQVDGYFGPETERATIAYQQAEQLTVGLTSRTEPAETRATGVVTDRTVEEARAKDTNDRLAGMGAALPLKRTDFEIGPHRLHDIRERRPYFLVPLDSGREDMKHVILDRIVGEVNNRHSAGRGVTDIYVLSHGWHRNFFGALAAYDRLVSRFAMLRRRGRLPHPDAEAYSPLFLTLHWHSDPGSDDWHDPAGRRNKESFIQNARSAFEPLPTTNESDFLNDFERIFAFFSTLAAFDTDALDPRYLVEAEMEIAILRKYRLRDAALSAAGTPAQKTEELSAYETELAAMAWACYHDSMPRRPLTDQGERPARYNGLFQAVFSTINFLVGLGLALTILGFIVHQSLFVKAGDTLLRGWNGLVDLAHGFIANTAIARLATGIETPVAARVAAGIVIAVLANLAAAIWAAVAAALAGTLYLIVMHLLRETKLRPRLDRLEYLSLIAWLPVALVMATPILIVSFAGFLIGGPLLKAWETIVRRPVLHAPGLFDERLGERGSAPNNDPAHSVRSIRHSLATAPRLAIAWLTYAVAPDSPIRALADGIDNQLAFWAMQVRGVETGREAAAFLEDVFAKCPSLNEKRLHFIGHSFGGLVVANVVRHLAYSTAFKGKIQTLCLLQAAIGSGWFENETAIESCVEGAVANIYSQYDTANGFYFPIANNSKMAAGYVGLTKVGSTAPAQRCQFASLVWPPNLNDDEYLTCLDVKQAHTGGLRFVNLDASRLIYQGNPAAGGGHTDIFKDDVIYLAWAATLLPNSAHAGLHAYAVVGAASLPTPAP